MSVFGFYAKQSKSGRKQLLQKNKRQIHRNIKFSCNDKEKRREEGEQKCSFEIHNQDGYSFIKRSGNALTSWLIIKILRHKKGLKTKWKLKTLFQDLMVRIRICV